MTVNITKPVPNDSATAGTWGATLNAALDLIVAAVNGNADAVAAVNAALAGKADASALTSGLAGKVGTGDARLTDTRTPTDATVTTAKIAAGGLAQSAVTGLVTALSGKATPADITTAINNLVAGAPGALDTLNEIATQLGADESVTAGIITTLAGKLDAATAASTYVPDLADVTVGAPAQLVAGKNSNVTAAGTYSAPAPAGTVGTVPRRFAITNNTSDTVTLTFPNPSGTTVALAVLSGEVVAFRQKTTSGYSAEFGNKPIAQLDLRFGKRTYGKLAGRTIRGRAGGRDAGYGSVTTAMTSFSAVNIPLAEPFISTGLARGTESPSRSVVIPAQFPPAWYEINYSAKFAGGAVGLRDVPIQLNGANVFEAQLYGIKTTPTGTFRAFLKGGDVITMQGYVETGSVTVTADGGTAVYLDVVAVDRPKVQPCMFGWSQTNAETATVATVPAKNEVFSGFFGINSWNDVEGQAMVTDTAIIAYVAANPNRALDIAGPLIPHGLGSATWDANLDSVTSGAQDAHFTALGTNLATYGPKTVYYRPWWEFNISTAQPTAAKFIAAWNRAIPLIRAAFAGAAPGKTLKILWCFSEGATPDPWYPDTANVDLISGDIYAMVYGSTTPSLNQLGDKLNVQLSILAQLGAVKNKPICISEFAQCAVQPGSITFQGVGDTPAIMDLYFDFIENAAVVYAGYHNYSASGVGITLANVPNTAARLEQRRALVSPLG